MDALGEKSVLRRQAGFNLLELMTTIVVLSVVVATGAPSAMHVIGKRRLTSVAEETYGQLRLLRAESVRHNRTAHAHFSGAGQVWSAGFDDRKSCNAGVEGDCTVDGNERRVRSSAYPGIEMATTFPGAATGFEPRRGMALNSGSISFSNDVGALRVEVSQLGALKLCTPAGPDAVVGYPTC